MIKLTEVVVSAGNYNSKERKMDSEYKLRNFYVNPKFIISMTDNEKLNNIHERQPIINDLLAEAKFTKLVVVSGTNGILYYDILGHPEQHLKNF